MCRVVETVAIGICSLLLARPVTGQLVVSQVFGGGGNAGAVLKADFVEVFNRGSVAVVVDGWSVQYASASAATWQSTPLSGTIAPGAYYLVQMSTGAGGTVDLPPADAVGVSNLSATSGKVALVASAPALEGTCPDASTFIDLVGYGSASCFEGSAAAASGSNTAAVRRAGNGCTDTDNNAADFAAATAAPRNQGTTPLVCVLPSTPTLTAAATPSATITPTPVTTPTQTTAPSETPTVEATLTPTATETSTPSQSASATASATPTTTSTTTPSLTPPWSPSPSVTPTQTATESATSTATGTRSPSSTPTWAPTWSPSPSAPAGSLCGNGAVEPGEQCDDGNAEDGDLCPSSAGSECLYRLSGALIHGDHRRRTLRGDGCRLQWYVVDDDLTVDRLGFAATTQVCRDQDAGCDSDPRPMHCRFTVVACFNNTDPSLTSCSPPGVSEARVLYPSSAAAAGSVRRANRLSVESAFATLVDPADPAAGAHALPLSPAQLNFCSGPFAFEVERHHSGSGGASLIVDTFAPVEGRSRRERVRLRLVCAP